MKSKYSKYFILLILLILGFFLYSYKLTEVPSGINGDEASIGYNAILVSETLRDENNRFLSFFILTLNGSDYKQPITFYTTTLIFKIFGPSFELLRLVSVLFTLLGLYLLFILTFEVFGLKIAVASAIIYLTTPIILIQSHLALENIAVIPFVTLWLIWLAKYQKLKNSKYLILASLTLSIGIFSYFGMRLIVPVYMLLTAFFIIYVNTARSKAFRDLKVYFWGLTPLIILIFILRQIYPGALLGSTEKEISLNLEKYLYPYLSTFDPSFLFFFGDKILIHSTSRVGMFLLASFPLFLLGLIYSLKSRDKFIILVLLSFFLTPTLFGLVDSVHRASRLLALIPLYGFICAYGIGRFIKQFKKGAYLILIFFFLMFVNFYYFVFDYWFDYPGRVKELFADNLHIAFQELSKNSKEHNLVPLVASGIYQKETGASRFFEKIYFKQNLETRAQNEDIPERAVILANDYDLETFAKLGYKQIKLDIPKYVLYIKE